MYFDKELTALRRANRYRKVEEFKDVIDLASNDYLGLASRKKSLQKAIKLLEKYTTFAPKASLLVNGYHEIHKKFEQKIAKANGFESGLVVGSGFLANIALIEAIVRRDDELFIDKEYHASGVMATKLVNGKVYWFEHNCVDDLEQKLKSSKAKRKIIAIEGVYSMSGDIAKKEIFDLANRYNALLIVDEAHSSGTIGDNLLGIFDYYNLEIKPNYIKMGTLGKAYGSYGAYILSSSEVKEFLINRAKPVIYSTAPSVIDTAIAIVNLDYILKNSKTLKKKLEDRVKLAKEILNIDTKSLILPIKQESNKIAKLKQQELLKKEFLVGAIRQPTVEEPILRVILRLGVKKSDLQKVLKYIAKDNIKEPTKKKIEDKNISSLFLNLTNEERAINDKD